MSRDYDAESNTTFDQLWQGRQSLAEVAIIMDTTLSFEEAKAKLAVVRAEKARRKRERLANGDRKFAAQLGIQL